VFKVEIDFVVTFVPPMSQHSRGITLTRAIELPFHPSRDVNIFGRDLMEDGSEPMGIKFKDIIWDMDRQVFFAKTYLEDGSCPLPMRPVPADGNNRHIDAT
jgi:hypothetical protein